MLSRLERVRILQERGSLQAEGPVLGLPKVKHLKMRIRKEKAAAAAGTAEAAAGGAAPTAAPATAPAGGTKRPGAPAVPEAPASKPKK